MQVPDYRDILKEELHQRCKINSQYSLRSFARHISMEPGQLSRVLSRKKNISLPTARLVAERLFAEEKSKNLFLDLVEYSIAKKEQAKNLAYQRISKKLRSPNTVNLKLQTFQVISDWYHLPILELIDICEGDLKTQQVAAYFGITDVEAKSAIDRMINLQLIKKEGSRLIRTERELTTPTNIPSPYLRRNHRQMISKALDSIEEQGIEERYLRNKTISIAAADIPKYCALIEEFMDEVKELNEKSKHAKNAVYQMNVQFFNLKSRKKK